MSWGNLSNWLSGSGRDRELNETREAWAETERLWKASPLASGLNDLTLDYMRDLMRRVDRIPALPIIVELANATETLLLHEDIEPAEAVWTAIDADVEVASNFRQMMVRRKRWAANFDQMSGIARARFLDAYETLFRALPETAFGEWREAEDAFGVPLVELLDQPAEAIHQLVLFPYDDETIRLGLFLRLRDHLATKMLVASGFRPDDDIYARADRLLRPQDQKGKSPSDLARLYLGGTPLLDVLELPVPFHIPEEARFEHCHIVGGTGHGKTQLMQRMIHADLAVAQRERRSVIVIDSQGDLINKLVRLALFDPNVPESLADRLVLIDPADIEFPAALNLFDAHLDRLRAYRPIDRERVLNGVIELYEVFFGAMLGAELTQKQGVIFRYLARLMLTIPGATIHTLMRLMEDGRPFKPHMEKLEGSARYFFESEFFHPSFAATRKQILKRLWGVLSTPAFERMFAQTENKLDLFEAMNEGKIILVSTAKDLLKSDGSSLLGRFFIAMLAQAALERSTIPAEDRTPTFVYIDEAQEYFDDSIETILNQARKYRVGLTLAHQTLDQLTPRLRSAIHSNTSLKCVGGVSAKDARALADELHTTADFIESMKRRHGRSEFAVWLKQTTPQAIRLSVPLGFLERQPLLTEEALEEVLDANRERYCGTLDDVLGFDLASARAPDPPTPAPDPTTTANDVPIRRDPPEERHAPEPSEPKAPAPRPTLEAQELGKGGSQHRYVQHLVKGLAEERGFRAVIEEPVEGGQIDVALYKGDLSIACEISVTSKPAYEAQNLAKCSQGRFTRVFAIAADAKRLKAIESAAKDRLSPEQLACIDFFTPEEIPGALDAFGTPDDETSVVRGYKVKVSRTVVGADEAKDRRAAIARVVAGSLRGLPKDE
ncbi:type IV secretory system conjugative DNA transfer family protein [Brevundimonas sp.]|uniref:type IV secretory system conjugative DNA transfer family protein n=1 Tax=Brevundimonas sp. TaxID=1871086 RepID=UPI002E124948|nr:type IV secretion system DNA-binding domain-containing protein [Brevundimonas sp.]